MQAYNHHRQVALATTLVIPQSRWLRMRGLLGRKYFEPGEGMLFTSCNWVHTFFMRFAIDLVFLDQTGHVLLTVDALVPYRLSPICWGARQTLELPAGTVQRTGTQVGDHIEVVEKKPE